MATRLGLNLTLLPHIPWLTLRGANFLRFKRGIFCLTVAASLVYFVRRYHASRRRLPLPPCPPKKGLFGHLGIMPKTFEYYAYEQWAKDLGSDIIHLQLGKMTFVVLDSWEAVDQVLEKNAPQYSDRYQTMMKSKMVGYDWPLSSLPYGERWRKGRALFRQHLHPSNVEIFEPRQLEFIRGLLLPQLLEGPAEINPVIKNFTAGISISMAYGVAIQPKDDPYIKLSEEAMDALVQASTPGRWFVDIFPLLRFVPSWFPGAGWKRKALDWNALMEKSRSAPFNMSMKAMANGSIKPSFCEETLQALGGGAPDPEKLSLIRDTAAIIYSAGADTTGNAISTIILALLCHPEVQEKAHAELDRVVGPNRLPTFEDTDNLPYITAIMKEGLRWQPPNPVAVPHMASTEGEYNGFRIPKGALVIGNIWALMHKEEDYPNPMEFRPERFLDSDGGLTDNVRDPAAVVFGFGRRLCPGRHIAFSAMWITIASVLAAFRIEKGIDDDGNPIEPEPKYITGFARMPAPFRATFTVRSKEMAELVHSGEEPNL